MTKMYKFPDKKPKKDTFFMCVIGCKMYLAIKRLDTEDCDPSYYYKIFNNKIGYYKEKYLLNSINMGLPIFEYWFYLPDFKDIDPVMKADSEFYSFGEYEFPSDEKATSWMKNAKAVGNSNFV